MFGKWLPSDHAVVICKHGDVVASTLTIGHVNISTGLVSISVQFARAKIDKAIRI